MLKLFKQKENLLSQLLYNVDKENFKSVKVARQMIKKGWIGKIDTGGHDSFCKVDLKYVPQVGDVLLLYDGMFGSAEEYWVTNWAGDSRMFLIKKLKVGGIKE